MWGRYNLTRLMINPYKNNGLFRKTIEFIIKKFYHQDLPESSVLNRAIPETERMSLLAIIKRKGSIWTNHHFSRGGYSSSLSFQGFLIFSTAFFLFVAFFCFRVGMRVFSAQITTSTNPENKLRTLMLFRSFAKWLIGWLTSGREFFQGKACN